MLIANTKQMHLNALKRNIKGLDFNENSQGFSEFNVTLDMVQKTKK